jgi:hypothetical protein
MSDEEPNEQSSGDSEQVDDNPANESDQAAEQINHKHECAILKDQSVTS